MRTFLEAAVEAARSAGELQRQRLWSDIDIRFKGEIDLVTEVDRASEALIVARLKARFPEHDILAEENDYGELHASHRWIIDPLDGTTNYAHGFPWFAVSIALEIDGEVRVGVVFQPVLGELFTAIKGEGAWLNGQPLVVSRRQPLRHCLLATGFPYDGTCDNENNLDNFCRLQLAARGIRRAGAAALDLAYVAAGRLDGYWECKLKPWDMAAGGLMVAEAGGIVTNHRGEPHSVYDHRIVASNGLIHGVLLEYLDGYLQRLNS